MKLCWVFVLLVLVVNGYERRSHRRLSMLRQFQDLLDKRNQYDEEEQYMELRTTNNTNTGVEITLQNRAAMNTRLRVLYTDAKGSPGIAETGRLWGGQTKSVRLPTGAQHVTITVEKDLFFETWRVAYQETLTDTNHCIRITGVTLISRIHSCK